MDRSCLKCVVYIVLSSCRTALAERCYIFYLQPLHRVSASLNGAYVGCQSITNKAFFLCKASACYNRREIHSALLHFICLLNRIISSEWTYLMLPLTRDYVLFLYGLKKLFFFFEYECRCIELNIVLFLHYTNAHIHTYFKHT